MARKLCKYVIGDDYDRGIVVGYSAPWEKGFQWAQPTTLKEAIRILRNPNYPGSGQIYELVPVDDEGKRLT